MTEAFLALSGEAPAQSSAYSSNSTPSASAAQYSTPTQAQYSTPTPSASQYALQAPQQTPQVGDHSRHASVSSQSSVGQPTQMELYSPPTHYPQHPHVSQVQSQNDIVRVRRTSDDTRVVRSTWQNPEDALESAVTIGGDSGRRRLLERSQTSTPRRSQRELVGEDFQSSNPNPGGASGTSPKSPRSTQEFDRTYVIVLYDYVPRTPTELAVKVLLPL